MSGNTCRSPCVYAWGVITETRKFVRVREDYFAGDEAYSALQQALLADPDVGSVMPGCGGLREMRRPDPRRGKGKRGGLRIIYLHVPEAQVVLFLKVYDKDEAEDLTLEQRRALAQSAKILREATLLRR